MDNFVITISRSAGSGGRTVGKLLANHYGISCYDKEILHLASEDSGINEALFAQADEKVKTTTLFKVSRRVYNGELIPPASGDFTSDRNLFNYQAKVLRELATQESYVVIGRAADFVLKDLPNVFKICLYASEEFCVRHEADRLCVSREQAAAKVRKIDRERNEFHHFYTGKDRNDFRNYDLCLNTSVLGFENAAKLIENYISMKLGGQ